MNKSIVPLVLTLCLVLVFMVFGKFTGLEISQNKDNSAKEDEIRFVTKVIDGDTLIVSGGETVRLLGIDTDERGYPCYNPAKKYLENLTLGKQVRLETEKEDKDQYGRLLRYIFLENENINIILVRDGMAVARLENNEKYNQEIIEAEAFAIENKIGCKWANSLED